MKLVLGTLLVLAAACGVDRSASKESLLASDTMEDTIIAAVKGCYEIQNAKISESTMPDHPAITGVLSSSKLCLEDSLGTDGSVSRSGRLLVTASNSANEIVGGAWGFEVAEGQPRCPGCYMFDGFDGTVNWSGEQRVFDPTAPITVDIKLNSLETTYQFLLGAKL